MSDPANEIDLLELLARITMSLKKNLLMLIITFVIGCGLGFTYYEISPKVYESDLIITSDILTEPSSKSLFSNILKLLNQNDLTSVSAILHLTEAQTKGIQDIDLNGTLKDDDNPQGQGNSYIKIKVKSSDNTIWPNLEIGIIEFIETNNFVKIRVAQRKKYFESLITKIDHELNDLELLKSKIMNGNVSSNPKDGMFLLDPTSINTKIIDLNKDKINFQNGLELVNSVQVIKSFTTFEKPVGPKFSIALLTGSITGLFVGFFLIGLKALRKLIRTAEDKIQKT